MLAVAMQILVLIVLIVLLLLGIQRTGPKTVFSQIPRAAFARPRSPGHAFIQFLWVLVTLRFGYIMFVQPFRDREIMEEYLDLPGGLVTAWLFYLFAYLPWLLIYLSCAFYYDRKPI
jgi:hypothetical protein